MPENAGEYKVVFSVEGNDNYTGLSKEITFTIEKASVSKLTAKTYTYDGKEKVFASETDLYSVENGKGTDAKTYKVILKLKDKENYKWIDGDSEDITLTFEIKQAENEWQTEPSLSKTKWTYGEESSVVSKGSATFGEVVVKYYAGEVELVEMPTNAGEYKVVFSVEGNDNYTGISEEITFVIEKVSVNLPNKPLSKEYTGQTLIADITPNDLYTIENNGGVNAGDYNVIFTLIDGANYKWADGKDGTVRKHLFTIDQADNDWVEGKVPSLSKTEWTYGEEGCLINKGSAFFGEVVVRYYAGENELSEIPTNAGEYKVVFSVEGNDNYTGISEEIIFVISRYQLVLEDVENSNCYYENLITLNDVKSLVKLNRDVKGEYTFTIEKGQIITDGNINVIVKFTPTDKTNYTTVERNNVVIKVYQVAYIGTNYYGSIESALSVSQSGDTVWVVAGEKNAIITENCEIPAGATLNIPHTSNQMNSDGKATLNGAHSTPTIEVITVIMINDGITLTNKGTLKVAGELSGGGGGHSYAGHTAGKSAKIIMKSNSKIHNLGGTINLFGIIVEETDNNGSQVIIEGGNLYIPYVVRDFRGGTYMSNIYKSATAFNEFELRNITSKVIVKNGANVYGYANLYAGSQHNSTTINLVSTTENAVIHFTDSNGYLTAKYNIVDGYKNVDTWLDGVLDLSIYGGAIADPMSLKVKYILTVTVSTADVFFPLSWRLKVSLFDGDYTMAYKYKIMPGHVFTVGAGATATIGTLIVYTQSALNEVPITSVPKPHYKTDIGDGQCIIKSGGKLIVSKAVGGNIIKEDGGIFEHNVVIQTYWTCNSCGRVFESKPSLVCSLSCLSSKFTKHETKSTTVSSNEGINDSGGTQPVELSLSINGVAV